MSFLIWRLGANANVRRAVAARRRNKVERIMVSYAFGSARLAAAGV
jgi:hypothetical protein